jgi:hypothetical protein
MERKSVRASFVLLGIFLIAGCATSNGAVPDGGGPTTADCEESKKSNFIVNPSTGEVRDIVLGPGRDFAVLIIPFGSKELDVALPPGSENLVTKVKEGAQKVRINRVGPPTTPCAEVKYDVLLNQRDYDPVIIIRE